MAARSVELILRILGDSSGAEKATKAAAGSVGKMQKTVSKLAVPAAIVVGAIAAFGAVAVKSASAAEEAFHALDAVFGKSADTVEAWAKASAKSTGLSSASYAHLAAVVGAQLKAMGLPMSSVLADTQALITKGADLSATFGGDAATATMALAGAMRGASKASTKYGLSLKPATVNALLAARGQDKLSGAALNAAKAQATLDLIAQQSSGSVGKFAEESTTAAGAAKIAAANWENAKAALGKSLLPAVSTGTQLLGRMGAVLENNATATSTFVGVIGGLALAILVLNGAIKAYNAVMEITTTIQTALRGSTIATAVGVYAIAAAEWVAAAATTAWAAAEAVLDALNPFAWVALIVVAVIALVAAIILAYKHSKTFRKIVQAAFAAVQVAAVAVARVVTAIWSAVWGVIGGGVRAFWTAIVAAFNAVRSVAVAVGTAIGRVFGPVFAVIAAAARLYFTLVRLYFTLIYTVARLAAQIIVIAFQVAFALLNAGAGLVAKVIVAAFNALAAPARAVAAAIGAVFRAGFNLVRSAASAMAGYVRSIMAPLVGPARTVANAIASVFRAAFSAITSAARAVAGAVSAALASVRSAFAAVGAVAKTIGSKIREGFAGVAGFLDSITSKVQALITWLGRIKIPKIKIPGVGSVGLSATAPARAATRGVAGLAYTPAAPRLMTTTPGVRTASTGSAGGLTVNVYGLLDGADAARKIRAVLRDDDRRRKGVRVVARTVAG